MLLTALHHLSASHPWLASKLLYGSVMSFSKYDAVKTKQLASISTHMYAAEKLALYWIAKHLPENARVVEVGSYLGASTSYLAAGLKMGHGGKVVCVDTWLNDAMLEASADVFDQFLENTEPIKSFLIPMRGKSKDIAQHYQLGEIDFLFIDGDHSYEGCHTDWRVWSSFLKGRSIVAFHDYTRAEGVRRVVDEEIAATHQVGVKSFFASLCICSLSARE